MAMKVRRDQRKPDSIPHQDTARLAAAWPSWNFIIILWSRLFLAHFTSRLASGRWAF